jgi:hypothetical protein
MYVLFFIFDREDVPFSMILFPTVSASRIWWWKGNTCWIWI